MIYCSINTFVFVTLMPTVAGHKNLKDLVIYQLIQIFFEEHSALKTEPGEEHAWLEGGGLQKSTHRKKKSPTFLPFNSALEGTEMWLFNSMPDRWFGKEWNILRVETVI